MFAFVSRCVGVKGGPRSEKSDSTAKGLSGVDNQIMNVLILRGEGGADLEIHQYVHPAAKFHPPMNHNDIGSMHFMLRVTGN